MPLGDGMGRDLTGWQMIDRPLPGQIHPIVFGNAQYIGPLLGFL
jgi:hypothetical protein